MPRVVTKFRETNVRSFRKCLDYEAASAPRLVDSTRFHTIGVSAKIRNNPNGPGVTSRSRFSHHVAL